MTGELLIETDWGLVETKDAAILLVNRVRVPPILKSIIDEPGTGICEAELPDITLEPKKCNWDVDVPY